MGRGSYLVFTLNVSARTTCERIKAAGLKEKGDAYCETGQYTAALREYERALWILLKAVGEVQEFASEREFKSTQYSVGRVL